jgi:hypothetical protein
VSALIEPVGRESEAPPALSKNIIPPKELICSGDEKSVSSVISYVILSSFSFQWLSAAGTIDLIQPRPWRKFVTKLLSKLLIEFITFLNLLSDECDSLIRGKNLQNVF